jgi:hypothetical protein
LIPAAAAATLAFAPPAAAQQQAAPKPVTRAAVSATMDATFTAADTNHDGSLSVAEIDTVENKELQQLLVQFRAKLRGDFDHLDTNKDGQLNFQEFAATVSNVKPNETPQQIVQRLDTNHDGKVSAAEFKGPRLSAFDKVDTNHDGIVTPAEIQAATPKK